MTITTSTTPTPEAPPEGAAAPLADQETPDEVEAHGETPSREAAKWRTRLRETEAERDAVTERLTSYQRREVERIAGASLSRAADVWLDGADVAGMLDEQGDVSRELVAAVVKGVLDGRPGLAPRVADHGAGRRESIGTPTSWGDVLAGRKG